MSATRVAVIATVALGLLTQSAHADKQKAEQLFRIGQKAYEAGLFMKSAEALEAAYQEWKSPDIAFSAAQAHRLHYFSSRHAPSLRRAAELYRVYLQEVPSGRRRADAALNLAELEPILRSLQPTDAAATTTEPTMVTRVGVTAGAKDAEISIDDGPFTSSPAIAEVKPGKHSYRARAPGHFQKDGTIQVLDGQFAVAELELDEIPARVTLEVEPGTRVFVDNQPVQAHGTIELTPGRHRIEFAKRGHQLVSVESDFARNSKTQLSPQLRWTPRRKIAVGLFIASAAGASLGIGYGIGAIDAHVRAKDLDEQRERIGLSSDERKDFNGLLDARDSRQRVSYALFGAATALAVAGGLVYYFDTPDLDKEVKATVSPAGVGISGRF
jgi:hypothetical protein